MTSQKHLAQRGRVAHGERRIVEAHRYMESNQQIGKIVVTV